MSVLGATGVLVGADAVAAAEVPTSSGISLWNNIAGFFHNAVYGTLTSAQKQDLINAQAQAVIAAGGDATQAATQAQQDVTAALVEDNADPSQSDFLFNNPGLNNLMQYAGWILAAVAAYFAFQIFRSMRR